MQLREAFIEVLLLLMDDLLEESVFLVRLYWLLHVARFLGCNQLKDQDVVIGRVLH